MKAEDVLDLLLTDGGEEWFLTKSSTGRAEITTTPSGVVVGIIECHQPEKNSNDDSAITLPALRDVKSSHECEQPV